MDTQAELQHIQSLLLDKISSAVSHRDVAAVAALSGLAKECETLETEFASLNRRVEAVKSALNGSWASSTISQKFTYAAEAPATSRKAAGAQARNEWVAGLRAQGIYLHGHRKRYQTAQGQSVAVAFANELPDAENRWFLGLTDEPTDVAVLLCKSLAGKRHDIVLPVSHLREVWRVLSRSHSGVKFNVRKDASRFLLLVPGNEPLDITSKKKDQYGNHPVLLYLDLNCFNRPFDEQSQDRIVQETAAVFVILQRIIEGVDRLVWSAILDFENAQHPLVDRRTEIGRWAWRAVVNVAVTPQVSTRAHALTAAGFRPLDAAHLACAEATACERFLTCDDQVLRRARRVHVGVHVQNPTDYVQEWTDA